ncbi:MAG: sigma-70 family RNA polymerase sigma factor [Phycisphaeraceae bacterium]|nr:sigma-70 family RNA polymerase sigma factor [Phycisphaerales bacterium]MCB9858821.1 sigma-70 family RNA polymerase sigma factor [Phycisphaeraceae bacterium]
MRSSDDQPDVTMLMHAVADGDREAEAQLLPLVYHQLRRAAQQRMAGERNDHTLSATALVHEAYLKLVGPRDVPWEGRAHFYAAAAQAMRRILIDHARSRSVRSSDRKVRLEDIGDVGALAAADSEKILAVDAAVTRLEIDDPEAAAVVRLRFFAGLSVDQAADAIGVSPRTAARLWTYARAVLYRELTRHIEKEQA